MRINLLALVLLSSCNEARPDTKEPSPAGSATPPESTPAEPEPEPEPAPDGGAAPAEVPELPTDVDAECWSWTLLEFGPDDEPIYSTRLVFYEPEGLLPTHNVYDYDDPGGGMFVTDYTYDAEGRLLTSAFDSAADGSADTVTELSYDAYGLFSRYSIFEWYGDGDQNALYEYTSLDGQYITSTLDDDYDGSVDWLFTYTYDAQAYLIAIEGDEGLDGTTDSVVTYTWDADYLGYTHTFDDGADGAIDDRKVYQFDAAGLLVHSIHDDVLYDRYETVDYTYTPDGDVETRDVAVDENGEPYYAYVAEYTYEAPGMKTSEVIRYTVQAWEPYFSSDYNHSATTWDCPGGYPAAKPGGWLAEVLLAPPG